MPREFVIGIKIRVDTSRISHKYSKSLQSYSNLKLVTLGKLLILEKYIFLIYGSDILEKRLHIHVTHARRGFKKSCKFWLEPELALDAGKEGDFTKKELREIEKLITKHKRTLIDQLSLFYSQKEVKAIRL